MYGKIIIPNKNAEEINQSTNQIYKKEQNKKYTKNFKNEENYKRKFGKELQNKKQNKIYVRKFEEEISTASSLIEVKEFSKEKLIENLADSIEIKSRNEQNNTNKISSTEDLSTSLHLKQNKSSNFLSDNKSDIKQKKQNKKCDLKLTEVLYTKNTNKKKRECPQQVKEYSERIKTYLTSKDTLNTLPKDSINNQLEINGKMRSKLVDWLIDVSYKFKLLDETLFSSIWYLDSYITVTANIKKSDFQLIGITCLMIASKFEEVYPPCIADFKTVCDNAYDNEQLLDCEAEIMLQLKFNLAFESSLHFYKLIAKDLNIKDKAYFYGEYLLNNALFDESCFENSQRIVSLAACFLVNKMFKLKLNFDNEENISDIKKIAKYLYKILKKPEKMNLTSAKRKFAKSEKFEVSKFKVERVNKSK